ncbi:uncharacterized protein LOC9651913 [Selaginella moellendorffii]|uniref:uncharacterized protein LOC9651913 n=1 Tax=Selaginella moellendorffii TaxID=88036 RepID=UPI000D1CE0F2|nr:uncharacterized protein LOC9651913 [Selaginella moellendorffii]|eukprot:XP_024517416.1 uncharacterized protein LOC9651913 [Selaginella moellendorffii]
MAKWSSKEDWDKQRQRQIQNLFLTVLCLSLAVLLIAVPREYRTTQTFSRASERIESTGKSGATSKKTVEDGVACDLSNYRTAVCRLAGDLRISGSTVTLFSPRNTDEEILVQKIKPYPRKWQKQLLEKISEVTIKVRRSSSSTPQHQCDVNHTQAAMIFSTGGYTGSVYHDFNDGLIPIYITSHGFEGEVVFLVSEFQPWWMKKYGSIVKQMTKYPVQDFSSNPAQHRVHCFPKVVVGLDIHDELAINAAKMSHGKSIRDFQSILSAAFSASDSRTKVPSTRPKLVFITRRRTRVVTNEEEVVQLAERAGFDVEALEPGFNHEMANLYGIIQSADVLLGVHGAAMTHLLFMRPGSLLLQIVPLGTKSPSRSFYGNPAMKAGMQYMEYIVEASESSLLKRFGQNHSVIVSPPENPGSSSGWSDMKKIYLDKQNVTISLSRFEPVLREAFEKISSL